MTRIIHLITVLTLTVILTGCGQKGPLRRQDASGPPTFAPVSQVMIR